MPAAPDPLKNHQLRLHVNSAAERRLIAALGILWLLAIPVLFHLYRTLDPSPDQSIFDYIAWLGSRGRVPYLDSFEINWPGAIVLHSVAHWIFGASSEAFRSFDYFIMQAAALAASAMLWRGGARVGAALLLAIYPPIYVTSGLWMAGQRDIIAGEFLLVACFWLSRSRRSTSGLCAAGGIMAFAIAIRPTYLSFLAGVVLLEIIWPANTPLAVQRWRAIVAILGGALLVVLMFIAFSIATGSLDSWYEDGIRYALECYGAQAPPQSPTYVSFDLFAHSWHWITGLAIAGALCWVMRKDLDRFTLMVVLGAIATGILSFMVQHKGFGYHLGGVLPFLVVLATVAADTLACAASNRAAVETWVGPWRAAPSGFYWASLALVLVIVAAGTALKLRHSIQRTEHGLMPVTMAASSHDGTCESGDVARSAAAFITNAVPATAHILPVNCGYRAAYLAQRLPASRFATSTAFGSKMRSCPIGNKFLTIYSEDIRANKPALILVSAANFRYEAQGLTALTEDNATSERVTALAKDYREVARFGDMLILAPDIH